MICRSVFSFLCLSAAPLASAAPVPLFPNSDFEAGTLANWTASGAAFTRQPTYHDNTAARGNVPCGLQGDYWVGTYENYDGITGAPGDTRGDTPVGTLTSQSFTIQKRYITFLMGGGNHPGVTGVKLVCEGQEYPMATGFDSESMAPVTFDAQALIGKSATLVIFDQATGGWGHINADNFQASDEPAPIGFRLTPGIPTADSPAIGYDQPQRPQFHFTSRRNWLNDPNGMVFDGEKYHFFFQHNPLGTGWGNMTWGHAVSTDMIHWRQVNHALLPYQVEGRSGAIYSGTAVVDHNNSLGLQVSSRKTLAAFFTYAHEPFYQALAHSTDGGVTWDYHDYGRAVVPNQGFDSGERDPKVFWHEASQKWVMLLWVQNNPGRVRFFTSTNLKDWTFASDLMRNWAFECMDMFPLKVDGNPAQTKWVIYDASFDYEIGSFDGTTFQTEAGPFHASHGNFYAAQTFNQAPNGRVVQIGWMNGGPNSAAAYGVPFNQQMSFPCDLSLRTTPDGVRLCANPIPEISSLVTFNLQLTNQPLTGANLISGVGALDLVDLSMEFEPGTATQVVIDLPRTTVRYNVSNSSLTFTDVGGNAASLVDGVVTQRAGRVKLRLLLDRLSLEAYAFDGEKFGAHYLNPNNGTTTPAIYAVGG
ncbi:MAG TPA: glycoside hydrolase family 32 protein, partial [Haloferula sp.]